MKKIFSKIKKLANSKVGKLALSAVPGGNIVKNFLGDKGGSGKVNSVLIVKDVKIDLVKLALIIAALGALFGWWSFEDVEKINEVLK